MKANYLPIKFVSILIACIFILLINKSVFAADPGTLKWSYEFGFVDEISRVAAPAIGNDGTIYVGSGNTLYAINSDGTTKWKYNTEGGIEKTFLAIDNDGTIYLVVSWHNLYAINPDGTKKWRFETDNPIYSPPAIGSDGTIYVGCDDLYAINPDGSKKWSLDIGGYSSVNVSPAIGSDGTIYVGSNDYNLYAINPNGTKKWSFQTGNKIRSSPAIGSNGTIYVGSNDYNLYAINPNGTKKWSFQTGGVFPSSPSIGHDGTIYIGFYDNKLYAINPDGTEKWSFGTGGAVYNSPTIGKDGTVYVVSYDCKLYAISSDGTLKWSSEIGDETTATSPVIGTDGTVYVGLRDNSESYDLVYPILKYNNKFYAINGNSGGLADSPWPMFGHDLRRTGNKKIWAQSIKGIAPLTINFNCTPIGEVSSWNWNFGDGSNSTEQSPSHTYNSPGEYKVVCSYINSEGDTYIFNSTTITVLPVKIHNVPSSPYNKPNATLTVNSTGIAEYKYKLNNQDWFNVNDVNSSIKLANFNDGNQTLSVIAGDKAGNWQAKSNATKVSWVVDTTAPAPSEVELTGIPEGAISANSTAISVTGEEIAQYKYAIDGGDYSAPIDVSENASLNLSDLGEGEHSISVKVRDTAGNWQQGENIYTSTWSRDSIAPEINGISNSTVPVQEKTWTWSANENATFRYAVNQNSSYAFDEYAEFNSTTNASLQDVDGTWYLHVQAKDEAGNVGEVTTVSALLDNTPPVAEIHNVPDNPSNKQNATFAVNSTGVAEYKYKLNNQNWSNASDIDSNTELTDLNDGNQTLSVIGVDQAGNWQAKSNATQASWIVDTTAPSEVEISGLPEDDSSAQTTTIAVSGDEVAQYKYAIDGGDYSAPSDASENASIDLSDMGEGNHTISVKVSDQAGNWQQGESVSTSTWTKDSIPPEISGISNSTAPVQEKTWTWSANENATFRHAVNQNRTYTFDDSVEFNSTTNASLQDVNGTWYLHVQAKDEAGNVGEVKTVSALLDNTAPVAEIHDVPSSPSSKQNATLTVNSTRIAEYKYKLNNQDWSDARDVDANIELTSLSDGNQTVSVIGVDQAGNWQAKSNATQVSWVVDAVISGDVNGDDSVTLQDLILVLQVSNDIAPDVEIVQGADVNSDGKIGMAEAIYIIQTIEK